ncbi:MAG: 2-haloacid dehalogenase, partial [Kiritimatiellia bacterium]
RLVDDPPDREGALRLFARYETAQERATPEVLYPELLTSVHARLRAHLGVEGSAELDVGFGRSIGDWPAYPDTVSALVYLKQHYQLVILSNVDRASFARTNEQLGVDFDAIYTAQDIGSYKPDPRNFAYMLEHLQRRGVETSEILHTAQSLYHDHAPATDVGLATNWIDRRQDADGYGATVAPRREVRVDFRFSSMAAFVQAHRSGGA